MLVAFTILAVISLIFVIVAIVIMMGRGDDFIVGYNIASSKTHDRYHIKRLRIIVGILLIVIAVALPSLGILLVMGYKEISMTVFPALAFILMFVYPDALGSGSFLVSEISHGEFTLGALAVLLVIKFIFSTASFGSGSPGGIFLPLLVLGAVTGGLFSSVLGLAGMDQQYITAFVVISMAGYFSAIVRAPVTGVILITEMTGDFTCLLPLVIAALIAYLIPEYFGIEPIYVQLLHRSQRAAKGRATGVVPAAYSSKSSAGRTGRGLSIRDRKTVIDAEVHIGSYMDGRSVMEFGLPLGTLIVSVLRDGVEIIPDGHTILRGGDELEILMRERDIDDVEAIIDERCRTIEKS